MPTRWRTSIGWCRGLFLVGMLLSIGSGSPAITGAEPVGFVPSKTLTGIEAAFRANLKAVRDWLSEKDFASAEETTRGLTSLAHLYGQQSADGDWRKRCGELQTATVTLADAAKRKAAADCAKAAERCGTLLDELAKSPPKPASGDIKPLGSVKTWMLLMEGGYVDAKSAKTPAEVELIVQGIAAEANAAAYLRPDATWRKDAFAVRDTATQIAAQTEKSDLATLRKSLKEIYHRCEACHDRSRKK